MKHECTAELGIPAPFRVSGMVSNSRLRAVWQINEAVYSSLVFSEAAGGTVVWKV